MTVDLKKVRKDEESHKCIHCGVELTDENWRPCERNRNVRVCRDCRILQDHKSRERKGKKVRKRGGLVSCDVLEERRRRRKENRCIYCGVKLTDENWRPSWRNKRWCCKTCAALEDAKYRGKKRDEVNEKKRIQRKFIFLDPGNKNVKGKPKRIYTGYCEVCGEENVRLEYHHWDDSNTYKGMWLCRWCHMLAEAIDRGKPVEKYLSLKKRIDSRWEKENTGPSVKAISPSGSGSPTPQAPGVQT